jgi:hypothetical protein
MTKVMVPAGRASLSLLVAGSMLPLSYLYVSFLYWLSLNPRFLPVGPVEEAVLVTQLLRALVVFTVPRYRRGLGLGTIGSVFAWELPVAAILLVLAIASGDAYGLSSLATQVFGAWAPSFLIAFLPLAIYKVASKMLDRSAPLAVSLPSLSLLLVALVVLVSATDSTTPGTGLMGVSRLLFATLLGSGISSSTPLPASVAATVIAVAVVVYGVSQGREAPAMRMLSLVFAAAGIAATIFWALLVSSFTVSSALAFAVPALALLGMIWWITRGR